MGSLTVKAATELRVGPRQVPIPVAAVVSRSAEGAGIRFGLDRGPADPPVTLQLGDVVGFVQDEIGAADLGATAGAATVREALPAIGNDLSPTNTTQVQLTALSFSATPAGTSFELGLEVVGASPTDPAIGLPADVAQWLSIRDIALSFSVTARP